MSTSEILEKLASGDVSAEEAEKQLGSELERTLPELPPVPEQVDKGKKSKRNLLFLLLLFLFGGSVVFLLVALRFFGFAVGFKL